MKKLNSVGKYIIAYSAWVIFILLFLWIILLSRETFLGFLRNFWVQGYFSRKMAITFIDRIFVLFIGITWLVLMIVIESYFRNGIKKGNLIQRISKVVGSEVFAIFIVDLTMTSLGGLIGLPWTRWAFLLLELVIGSGLILVGWKFAKRKINMEKN